MSQNLILYKTHFWLLSVSTKSSNMIKPFQQYFSMVLVKFSFFRVLGPGIIKIGILLARDPGMGYLTEV